MTTSSKVNVAPEIAVNVAAALLKLGALQGRPQQQEVSMNQTTEPLRADLAPIIIALPTADRRRSFHFYATGLNLEPIFGEVHEDGLPEPLQFVLNDGARLMMIPTGGFKGVTSNRPVANSSTSECLLTIAVSDQAAVIDLIERARHAGGEIVSEPTEQPWGYAATFADPDGHVWQVVPIAILPLYT